MNPINGDDDKQFRKERPFANDEGLGFVADDFNEPLPPELLKQFYE